MLLSMLKFEWRYFVRQPSFFVTSLVFFLLPYFSISIENVQIGDIGNTHFNSPYSIAQTMLIFGFFAIFLVVNFVSSTAIRNDVSSMSEIIYTKAIPPFSYQLGRFLGAYLVILTVSAMVPLGLFVGSLMPWIDQARIGTFSAWHYISPFLIFTLPTTFSLATIFYALALRFRSVMPVYLCALAMVMLFSITNTMFNEPHQQGIMSLTDVFGLTAFFDTTQYWTPSQRNVDWVGLSGEILNNRLLWTCIGLGVLFGLGRLFSPMALATKNDKSQRKSEAVNNPIDYNIAYKYQSGAALHQFIMRTKFEIKQVIMSPAFLILVLIGLIFIGLTLFESKSSYGVANWPLTQYMVELIRNGFSLSLIIIITYYTAEVVWRERSAGIGDIIDSMPVHNFTFWFSKLIAVCCVVIALLAVGMFVTISQQLINGHVNLDIQQYIVSLLYFNAAFWILLTVLAFFIQALSANKYMGMLIFVIYYFIARIMLSKLGLEHNMFNYGRSPGMQYSDMNGYGWSLITQYYYILYWGAFALVLGALSYAMWQRGPDTNLKNRLSIVGYSLGKGGQIAVVIGTVVFISVGTIIHYNTRLTNEFKVSEDIKDARAEYEKLFGQYEDAPLPSITAVDLEAAIFPKRRKIELIARLNLLNTSEHAITKFIVNYPNFSTIEITGAKVKAYNHVLKTAWLHFDEPLEPNEEHVITVNLTRQHLGFKDKDEDVSLVKNGTFIDNLSLLPRFGVHQTHYLTDQHERRKHDLPPLKRAHKLEDSSRYTESVVGPYVGLIDFKAKLSTSDDQIAIAPGSLKKYWTQSGRNYFIYEMDSPMLNFYTLMSADLEVKSTFHDGVNIAVYYHREHIWNIDRMLESSADALDFYSKAFGPYQHKQLRIVEFPRYRKFAQSFANTVPYSEGMGFITDLRDSNKLDPVYYVTAHEVAHQWFGHQLNPANVQGSQVLSESLSQYGALQVTKKRYGDIKIRKFLTYELDAYLKGRTTEYLQEMPLMRAENQAYIHYRKGAIVLMAIADRIGFEVLNGAIKDLLKRFKFSQSRLATTTDLLTAIKNVSDTQHHEFIEQQFKYITLYNISLKAAHWHADSQNIDMTIDAQQFTADGQGNETKKVFNDLVDVVLFSSDPNNFDTQPRILYQQKHRLFDGDNTLKISVSGLSREDLKDAYLGVDPFVRYIDRDSKDNIRKL